MAIMLGRARWDELAAVLNLLQEAALPLADVSEHFEHFLVARDAGRVVGAVGLQITGRDAVLRSLVVDARWRGRGLGRALVDQALLYAGARGVQTAYLLTTTADRFFERLGFERCDRGSVPASIAQTSEFAGVCPSTAVCMRRSLASHACGGG